MNDLDQLREFRAELPYPERSRLTPGRTRLLSAARRPPRRLLPAPHRNIRLLLPATAAAAAITVAAGAVGYGLSTGHGQVTSTSEPPSQATLAVRVLGNASAAASRVPPRAAPSPGQWIYSKFVQYEYPNNVTSDEHWITFAGAKATYRGGRWVVHNSPITPPADLTRDPLGAFNRNATPQTAYYALASLPRDPRQLLAAVARAAEAFGTANLAASTPLGSSTPRNKGQLEFDYLTLLLSNAAAGAGAPPAAQAAAFRAMAAIPGVTVQQGITDAAGAPAIGVSDDGGYDQLLLDPVSYQVIGQLARSTENGPKRHVLSPKELAKLPKAEQQQILRKMKTAPPELRKGTVVFSVAYTRVSEVSGPGVR
jgi:hypothetical protein